MLYVEGCPHRALAERRLRDAAHHLGVLVDISSRLTSAEEPGFKGSPTLLFDGVDPFSGTADGENLTCRLYRTQKGLEGAPSLEDLQQLMAHAGAISPAPSGD